MQASDTRWRFALLALGAFACAVGLAAMNRYPVGGAIDDAMYVVLAKSLATGQGYRSLNLPGAPLNTHFPPGYPATLALLWQLVPSFPANVLLFKLFNVLCLGVASVATARLLAARGLERTWALGIGALTAISVPCLVLGTVLLSETYFLGVLLLALPVLERFADRASDGTETPAWRALVCGLLIGGIALVRSHGIVALPALLLPLAAQRRWRDAALVTAGALLCVVPWQLWTARHGAVLPAPLLGVYDSYAGWWLRGARTMGVSIVSRTLAMTIPETTGMFATLFSPLGGVVARLVTWAALVVLAVLGMVRGWRRFPVTLLFLAGYLAIVIAWPGPPTRFVWGVWPLILVTLALGVRYAVALGDSWRSPRRIALVACACWVTFGYGAYELRGLRGQWWSSIPRAAASRIAFSVGWTRANTSRDAVIATDDEAAVYLYTGRPTVPVWAFTVQRNFGEGTPATMAAEGLVPLLAAYPVSVVIATSRTSDEIARNLAGGPEPRLALTGQYPAGSTYSVLRR